MTNGTKRMLARKAMPASKPIINGVTQQEDRMSAVQWTVKLEVGHGKIDEQHKQLVAMLASLDSAMTKNNRPEIDRVLDGLVDYTVTHFGTEERLMDQNTYPAVSEHKSEHAKFIDKVQKARANFNTQAVTTAIVMGNFLNDWLVSHIQTHDKKLGAFLSAREAK